MSYSAYHCEASFDGCLGEDTIPVCLDENMETYMCRPCIEIARSAMDVEILDDER